MKKDNVAAIGGPGGNRFRTPRKTFVQQPRGRYPKIKKENSSIELIPGPTSLTKATV